MEKLTGNAVKKYLREQGFDTKKISVSMQYGSINITLKDLNLSVHEIEKTVKEKYESISTDEATGEILSGGNTFVFCQYDQDLMYQAIDEKLEAAKAFYEEVKKQRPGFMLPVYENDNFQANLFLYENGLGGISIIPQSKNAKPSKKQVKYMANSVEEIAEALFFIEKEGVIFTEFYQPGDKFYKEEQPQEIEEEQEEVKEQKNDDLTFENVKNGNYKLAFEIDKAVGERYEQLTSFNTGRDFNKDVRGWIEKFVNDFYYLYNAENKDALNKRLNDYNKLIVDLKTKILQSTKIPSMMIAGPAKYPVARKERELERTHELEGELYSDKGKHAKFIRNTLSMYDLDYIAQREKTEKMRKERSEENGWKDFYKELEHEEIAGYGIDEENNRVYVKTHGKPNEETRKLFKRAALKWSPKNGRWQRILTANAIFSLVKIIFEPENLNVKTTDFQAQK